MQERFILTFLFHLFSLSLLLIPNRFQGPVVIEAFGTNFRVLDLTSVVLIIAGSVFLYASVYRFLRTQDNPGAMKSPENGGEKTENHV